MLQIIGYTENNYLLYGSNFNLGFIFSWVLYRDYYYKWMERIFLYLFIFNNKM